MGLGGGGVGGGGLGGVGVRVEMVGEDLVGGFGSLISVGDGRDLVSGSVGDLIGLSGLGGGEDGKIGGGYVSGVVGLILGISELNFEDLGDEDSFDYLKWYLLEYVCKYCGIYNLVCIMCCNVFMCWKWFCNFWGNMFGLYIVNYLVIFLGFFVVLNFVEWWLCIELGFSFMM